MVNTSQSGKNRIKNELEHNNDRNNKTRPKSRVEEVQKMHIPYYTKRTETRRTLEEITANPEIPHHVRQEYITGYRIQYGNDHWIRKHIKKEV